MDEIDQAILEMLQEDAFVTHKEIAQRLHMSITPVFERIRRLEQSAVIRKYVALVDRSKVDKSLLVCCSVSLKEHSLVQIQAFEKAVVAFPEVTDVLHIAGNYDYMLRVVVKDMAAYQHFLVHRLASLDNIGHAHSAFVLSELKSTTRVPIGG